MSNRAVHQRPDGGQAAAVQLLWIMERIEYMSLDIETYSSEDLKSSGVYRYSEAPDFEILLLGVSVNGGAPATFDIASGEKVPDEIVRAIADEGVIKWAFNASFERVCLSRWLKRKYPQFFKGYGVGEDCIGYLNPISWRCSMVWSAYLGLPLSLDGVGRILRLENQKMKEGASLIHYFSVPCRPTRANGGRTRNLPCHDVFRWDTFKAYNIRDVEVEMAIQKKLSKHPVPEAVWEEYMIDQRINDRGILIDMDLVENAIAFDGKSRSAISRRMREITSLENPNSVSQVKGWLRERGLETETLGKKAVASLISETDGDTRDVLELRLQIAKSSIRKYQAMADTACHDNRARGMFQFYGANRSGRWAGRHIQLQNLPQNHIYDLAGARSLVLGGDYDLFSMFYGDVPDTLSQLIRTAFIPRKGYKFIVSDFSAIEARVLSFLAGESWRIDVFRNNGDIYCASASAMFKVPVEKHGQNFHLRQKGKIAELALGYGGSVGALKAMGALNMGLKEEELQPLVSSWRNANTNIVSFWWQVDSAVRCAIGERTSTETHGLRFEYQGGMLYIHLPSGRKLSYVKPRLQENGNREKTITYEGVGATKKWERIESYGPKFVENITQAISRDILAYAMRTLGDMRIVAHVHDELIIEAPLEAMVEDVCLQMGKTPPWIEGLYLRADGYGCEFYMKE